MLLFLILNEDTVSFPELKSQMVTRKLEFMVLARVSLVLNDSMLEEPVD